MLDTTPQVSGARMPAEQDKRLGCRTPRGQPHARSAGFGSGLRVCACGQAVAGRWGAATAAPPAARQQGHVTGECRVAGCWADGQYGRGHSSTSSRWSLRSKDEGRIAHGLPRRRLPRGSLIVTPRAVGKNCGFRTREEN